MEAKTSNDREIFSNYPDVVDVAQMCEMLGGICTKTGLKLLKDNRIKYFKVGNRYMVAKYHILNFLEIPCANL